VDWLNQPAVFLWGAPVGWAEAIGAPTGALCVWLLARQHLLNWPLGLVNNVLYVIAFWNAKLYADSSLQVVFFALGVYGWWMWVYGGASGPNTLAVRRTRPGEWVTLGVLSAAGTAGTALLLRTATDSPVPLWDASVLTLSLVATYGQARKLLECWWVWIVVDVISIPLYITRALYPTAALYALFLVLCIGGLRAWRRELSARREGDVPLFHRSGGPGDRAQTRG
jgi:nicotinamide mononucleotide transporter